MQALSTGQKSLAVLLLVVLTRLLLLPLYPLMDTTEARYGEMARLMVETGNWVTPLFDYGVPFWGKPPLHTWMSAASIVVFGVSEFAVRFPHWIAAMLTLAVIATFAKKQRLPVLPSLIILASTVVFIISAGAVMTDMALTLGLTMAMVGFYLCWQGELRWGYFGFVGLAIGLLAKGPVALVIFAIGTGLWLLWQYGVFRPWKLLWQRIPLISGLLLMLAIALPWYVLAEKTTPGFLNYFIVGEHWSRFVDSGWQGDLYGSAHDQTRGTIWLYFLGAALPWSAFLPQALYKIYVEAPKHSDKQLNSNNSALASYLICWMLAPMVLFTLAGNILPAYVLPGIPALALLITFAWRGSQVPHLHKVAIAIAALLMVAVAIIHFGSAKDKSERWLLQQRTEILPTYYLNKQPFSARFYSAGQAEKINRLQEVDSSEQRFYLVVDISKVDKQLVNCDEIASNKDRGLLLCRRSH
ncbi:phospholipid carrier-dependent glycosyltransferase [Shewanella sp. c952]|uniref:ArnT family glycosyltransferase n=1 Tax=Shewanella sp. c952 TaxID=2815913 RepID=UPI001BC0D827|nr:glycosyltransferase family 39 protein [Shewanella sp. c952]GIU07302.1 phospholipid carrier-dependent glycosyltransferase [Shewanella sp. c952]